jgi:sortase A
MANVNFSKFTQRQRVVLFILLLIAFAPAPLAIYYLRFAPNGDSAAVVTPAQTADITETSDKAKPGVPLRLKIPKINVDAAIDHVGLTSTGDLDVPKSFSSTGWYKGGVRPGEAGSAVIDGHFINGEPAVFNNLQNLQKGDELYVEDESGSLIKFIVRGSRLYLPNENAAAVFYSDDGKERLNLITCQGTWDRHQQDYTTRLVVFADKG